MKKNRIVLSSVLALGLVATICSVQTNTSAKEEVPSMKIQREKLSSHLEKNKNFKKSFNRTFAAGEVPDEDLQGDINFNLKFIRTENAQLREVAGKIVVHFGGNKISFPVEHSNLIKAENIDGETIYILEGDSVYNTDKGEEPVAFTFAWTKDQEKLEGALSIGDVYDNSYLVFGETHSVKRTTEEEREYLANHQMEFNDNEYSGE